MAFLDDIAELEDLVKAVEADDGKGKPPAPAQTPRIQSRNEGWGFHGTIAKHGHDPEATSQAFHAVADRMVKVHGLNAERARGVLDSRHGRHLAAEIGEAHAGAEAGRDGTGTKKANSKGLHEAIASGAHDSAMLEAVLNHEDSSDDAKAVRSQAAAKAPVGAKAYVGGADGGGGAAEWQKTGDNEWRGPNGAVATNDAIAHRVHTDITAGGKGRGFSVPRATPDAATNGTKKTEGTMGGGGGKVVKSVEALEDLVKGGGEGSRGGHVIGHRPDGTPIYESASGGGSHAERHAAAQAAFQVTPPHPDGQTRVGDIVRWGDTAELPHNAQVQSKHGVRIDITHDADGRVRRTAANHRGPGPSGHSLWPHDTPVKVTYMPKFHKALSSAVDEVENLIKGGGEGSRGGHVIGHTANGDPIYEGKGISHEHAQAAAHLGLAAHGMSDRGRSEGIDHAPPRLHSDDAGKTWRGHTVNGHPVVVTHRGSHQHVQVGSDFHHRVDHEDAAEHAKHIDKSASNDLAKSIEALENLVKGGSDDDGSEKPEKDPGMGDKPETGDDGNDGADDDGGGEDTADDGTDLSGDESGGKDPAAEAAKKEAEAGGSNKPPALAKAVADLEKSVVPPLKLARDLLGLLKAMAHLYETAHWQAAGGDSYGDHQLFQRLYWSVKPDTLAERMVGTFGNMAVDDEEIAPRATAWLKGWKGSAVERGLAAESDLQRVVDELHTALEGSGDLSRGWDAYLGDLAQEHDTNHYLLSQRATGGKPTVESGPAVIKAVDALEDLIKGGGEGSRGGHVVGHRPNGDPIYARNAPSRDDHDLKVGDRLKGNMGRHAPNGTVVGVRGSVEKFVKTGDNKWESAHSGEASGDDLMADPDTYVHSLPGGHGVGDRVMGHNVNDLPKGTIVKTTKAAGYHPSVGDTWIKRVHPTTRVEHWEAIGGDGTRNMTLSNAGMATVGGGAVVHRLGLNVAKSVEDLEDLIKGDKPDTGWRTIRGTHVHFGSDGKIDKGPASMVGHTSSSLPDNVPGGPHAGGGSGGGSQSAHDPRDIDHLFAKHGGNKGGAAAAHKEHLEAGGTIGRSYVEGGGKHGQGAFYHAWQKAKEKATGEAAKGKATGAKKAADGAQSTKDEPPLHPELAAAYAAVDAKEKAKAAQAADAAPVKVGDKLTSAALEQVGVGTRVRDPDGLVYRKTADGWRQHVEAGMPGFEQGQIWATPIPGSAVVGGKIIKLGDGASEAPSTTSAAGASGAAESPKPGSNGGMKLTGVNRYVLAKLFESGDTVSNKMDATSIPHAKRLLAMGYLQHTPDGKSLTLTEKGKAAVAQEKAEFPQQWSQAGAGAKGAGQTLPPSDSASSEPIPKDAMVDGGEGKAPTGHSSANPHPDVKAAAQAVIAAHNDLATINKYTPFSNWYKGEHGKVAKTFQQATTLLRKLAQQHGHTTLVDLIKEGESEGTGSGTRSIADHIVGTKTDSWYSKHIASTPDKAPKAIASAAATSHRVGDRLRADHAKSAPKGTVAVTAHGEKITKIGGNKWKHGSTGEVHADDEMGDAKIHSLPVKKSVEDDASEGTLADAVSKAIGREWVPGQALDDDEREIAKALLRGDFHAVDMLSARAALKRQQ